MRGPAGFCAAIRQIYIDYHLPISPRDITFDEILFFYEPLVEGLLEVQRNARAAKSGRP